MWKYCEIYCVNITIYIKEKKKCKRKAEEKKKKKTVATIATVPLGTVATVQNLKKKKRQSGSTKWHCRCTVQKHYMYSAKVQYVHSCIYI